MHLYNLIFSEAIRKLLMTIVDFSKTSSDPGRSPRVSQLTYEAFGQPLPREKTTRDPDCNLNSHV